MVHFQQLKFVQLVQFHHFFKDILNTTNTDESKEIRVKNILNKHMDSETYMKMYQLTSILSNSLTFRNKKLHQQLHSV